MYLPTRYSTKSLLASVMLLAMLAFALVARSQETSQEKPAQDKPVLSIQTPTPPEKPKLGTELDGPIISHTDLVTLTVNVTDTYGRYVSGLSKTAFSVLDNKAPQEITFFS